MTGDSTDSGESFEQFKNSFSYGSRSDLSFKFLKSLSDEDAAEFFRGLLAEVGETFDDGNLGRIHDHVIEWQVRGYTPKPNAVRRYVYEDRPFAALGKPLSEARLGLVTSSGHFAAGDDPQPFGVVAMSQQEAEQRISEFLRASPDLSIIDRDLPAEELRVRHGGYDIRSVTKDHNVALPRDRLLDAAAAGRIGEVSDRLYSFTGATAQGRLRKQAAPEWVAQLQRDAVDAVLLVPV
jgi:hypothetical protein